MGRIIDKIIKKKEHSSFFNQLTKGVVMDARDPLQQGRCRILCPVLGDREEKPIDNLPWALQVSPFAGTVGGGRGYGAWGVPREGDEVLVACLDGNISNRIYLGSFHGRYFAQTLPHGNYATVGGHVHGPFDVNGNPIQPMYDNQRAAFTKNRITSGAASDCGQDPNASAPAGQQIAKQNPPPYSDKTQGLDTFYRDMPDTPEKTRESFTRGPHGTTVSAITPEALATPDGQSILNQNPQAPTQGTFEVAELLSGELVEQTGTGYNKDESYNRALQSSSQTFSFTSAGMQALSFDDREWHKRTTLMNSSGSKVILDDTNQRIYISSAKGNNWVEMSENGNVDVYAGREVSIASDSDINIYSKKSVRIRGESGVHISSGADLRIHSKTELHIKANGSYYMETDTDLNILAAASIYETAGEQLAMKAGIGGYFQSGCALNFLSGGPVYVDGPEVHIKSTKPQESPDAYEAKEAFWPNRITEKEPWPRASVQNNDKDKDNKYDPGPYVDAPVNQDVDGVELTKPTLGLA